MFYIKWIINESVIIVLRSEDDLLLFVCDSLFKNQGLYEIKINKCMCPTHQTAKTDISNTAKSIYKTTIATHQNNLALNLLNSRVCPLTDTIYKILNFSPCYMYFTNVAFHFSFQCYLLAYN